MGLFDIFKKELACACCSQHVDKGQLCLCEFEAPPAGEKNEQQLCPTCLAAILPEHLKNYKGKIVAVWPMKKYPAYHLYRFEKMPGMEYSGAFIAAIQRKLPIDQTCSACSQEAKISCFSPQLVNEDPLYDSTAGNGVDEKCPGEYFCADCFVKLIIQKTVNAGWFLGNLVIPSQGNAFFTPAE